MRPARRRSASISARARRCSIERHVHGAGNVAGANGVGARGRRWSAPRPAACSRLKARCGCAASPRGRRCDTATPTAADYADAPIDDDDSLHLHSPWLTSPFDASCRPTSIRARAPRSTASRPCSSIDRSPRPIGAHLEDAAHFPGGHADAVARPRTEAEVAGLVQAATHVLPIGAQSSVTGGATPDGGLVLSTERLTSIQESGQYAYPRRRGGPARDVAETADVRAGAGTHPFQRSRARSSAASSRRTPPAPRPSSTARRAPGSTG